MKIQFAVHGYVTQEIEIVDSNYTIYSIKKGLSDGTLCTTIFECDYKEITVIDTGEVVATISSTTPTDELEYSEFEILD